MNKVCKATLSFFTLHTIIWSIISIEMIGSEAFYLYYFNNVLA